MILLLICRAPLDLQDMMVHRKENLRILQENIALITEINTLRREMKAVKDQQRKQASQSVGIPRLFLFHRA